MSNNPDLVNYRHPTLANLWGLLETAHDLWIGRRAWFDDTPAIDQGLSYYKAVKINNKAQRYLPRGEGEESSNYISRLANSRFDRFFRNAIEKDFASILSRFQVKDIHPVIESHLNNFDRKGNSIYVFAHSWISKALRDGMAGVFINYPRVPEGTRLYDIQSENLRPYPILYQRKDILNWRFDFDQFGQRHLTKLVLVDYGSINSGLFGVETQIQYKYLYMEEDGYQYCQILGIDSDKTGNEVMYEIEAPVRTAMPYISFVPLGLDQDPFEADLPFEDLMDLNISHYRKQSGTDWYMELCKGPTLNCNDLNPAQFDPNRVESIKLGPHSVIRNKETSWLFLPPQATEPMNTDVDRIEDKIHRQTLAFLSGNAAKTATEALLESTQTQANILGMAEYIESAFQTLFRMWTDYVLLEPVPYSGSISLEQTLGLVKMAIMGDVKDVITAFEKGILSRPLTLRLLQERGFFGNEFTPEQMEGEIAGISIGNGGEAIPEDAPLGL